MESFCTPGAFVLWIVALSTLELDQCHETMVESYTGTYIRDICRYT